MSDFRIRGETGEWEVVVGLEVHAQITATASKLFSGSATAFGAEPNTQVSLPASCSTWSRSIPICLTEFRPSRRAQSRLRPGRPAGDRAG